MYICTVSCIKFLKPETTCQDPNLREFLSKRLISLSENIARAYRATATVDLIRGSSTIENDSLLAMQAADAVKSALGEEHVVEKLNRALIGSDDFANYTKTKPGVYFFLHTNNKEKGVIHPNHSPLFDVDEEVLWRGVGVYVAIADNI